MDSTQAREKLASNGPEQTYNLLTGYRFAQRYAEGKCVADLGGDEIGYGARILAETAESVKGLSNSPDAIETASETYTAPNVEYRQTSLPDIPFPRDSFDMVVALGLIEKLEYQESLLASIKHVLKPDGTLVLSTPDKQAHSNERNRGDSARMGEMYVQDLREMLLRHFSGVSLYRQGAVSGGVIFREDDSTVAPHTESSEFTLSNPSFDADPPATDHVIAVCTDSEHEDADSETPYLLLDRDRRVFDEYDERNEDAKLLQEEIQQLQATEVQAFRDGLKRRDSQVANLKAQLRNSEAQQRRISNLEAQVQNLEARDQNTKAQLQDSKLREQRLTDHVRAIESSRSWRILGVYRGLRAGIDTLRKG